jgi:putative transposase
LAEADVGLRRTIAKHLGLNRNGLYYYSRKQPADKQLATRIDAVLKEHKHYGYRRIAIELSVGKHQVRRVMRAYSLHPESSPHQRHYKQHSGTRPAPPNVLKDEHIVAARPNQVWACDFTYLWCLGRWYYVATVIDVFSREIVGWGMSYSS